MLWYSIGHASYESLANEIKQKAVDIAKAQLNLATYTIREIRPEDLPSPSVNNFVIACPAAATSVTVTRKISSNSLLIVAGFYAPDVKNNQNLITGTLGEALNVTLGFGNPVFMHVHVTRGTELIRRWPLCPVYADEYAGKATSGYVIFYPDDVAIFRFWVKETQSYEQVSQLWYLGIVLTPPGSTSATTLAT